MGRPWVKSLNLKQRMDLDLFQKTAASSVGIFLWSIISLFMDLGLEAYGSAVKTIGYVVAVSSLVRFALFQIASRRGAFPEKDIALIKPTIPLTVAMMSLQLGLILLERKLSGIPSIIALAMVALFCCSAVVTLGANLLLATLVQALLVSACLIPIFITWNGTHADNLVELSFVYLAFFIYLVKQTRDVHKQILQRYEYEISLERANEELVASRLRILEESAKSENAARLASLGEMAGGIAHEINNPVSIISLLSGQIERYAGAPEIARDQILKATKKIDATADRIARIVRGLRSFSRDAENDPFERVTVNALMAQISDVANGRFYNLGMQVQIEHEDKEIAFDCRQVQISQVFVNLLNNSYDAVRDLQKPWIKITSRRLDDRIEFRVIDAGQGIGSAEADKIFNPFYTTKEIGKGTGLGLSISLGIIKQHGGSLRLDSGAANTTFVIELPIRQKSIANKESPQTTSAKLAA